MKFIITPGDAARLIAALADATSKGRSFEVTIDVDGFIDVNGASASRASIEESE